MPKTATKKKHHGKRRENSRVLGIGFDISQCVMVDQERPLLAVLGGAVTDSKIKRTIDGASNIQLTVHDPARKLLRHDRLKEKWVMDVDGLKFRYKGATKEGPDLILNFIEENVARLQEVKGTRKAYRDQVTRAEFILSEVREADGPPIPVRIFELHKRQQIKHESDKERKKQEQNESGEEHTQGEPGLGKADRGHITVKHVTADLSQIHIIDTVLDTGMSMGVSFKLLVCAIMTITQESDAVDLAISGGPNGEGFGPFSQTAAWRSTGLPGGVHGDVPACARGFFQAASTVDKAHPSMAKGPLCQEVQHAGAGQLYSQWEDEATRTVEKYLGGSDVGSVEQTVTERYAFERKKKEDAWKNSLELAKEVRWRRFMVAGKFFYVPDTFLMRAKRRDSINEEDSGVDTIDFEIHENKDIDEVTVECRADYWRVPPGCIVHLDEQMGPAEGNYLVIDIEGTLFRGDKGITVKLHKPVEPLKEPANETHTKSISVPGGGTGSPEAPPGMPANVVKMMVEAEAIEGTPYKWGGGHGSASDLRQRLKEYDCSGAVSRILYVGGYLDEPLTSGALASKFEGGRGEWFTIWANAAHVWIEFRTVNGWRAWEEGGTLGNHAGWSHESTGGYSPRHPKGT